MGKNKAKRLKEWNLLSLSSPWCSNRKYIHWNYLRLDAQIVHTFTEMPTCMKSHDKQKDLNTTWHPWHHSKKTRVYCLILQSMLLRARRGWQELNCKSNLWIDNDSCSLRWKSDFQSDFHRIACSLRWKSDFQQITVKIQSSEIREKQWRIWVLNVN